MTDPDKRSSFNAFGDDPVQVRPCKCGYQWREGALPEEVCSHGGGEYVVVCFRCKASGELKATPLWAVEAWNNSRTDPIGTAQEREVDRLITLMREAPGQLGNSELEYLADALESRIAEGEALREAFDRLVGYLEQKRVRLVIDGRFADKALVLGDARAALSLQRRV